MFTRKPIFIIIILLLALTTFAIAQTQSEREAEQAQREAERAQRDTERQMERQKAAEARRQVREAMQKEKEKEKEKEKRVRKDDMNFDAPGEIVQEVKVKITGNARVNVSNFLGDIHVTGTNSDTLEAVANDGNDRIPLKYSVNGSTYTISHSPAHSPHQGDANIEVKLPRSAAVGLSVITGDATITDVSGDVKANVVTGDLRIECAKGQVDARCVSGSIEIIGAVTNLQSESVSGDITFRGEIRAGGTYRLKSLSGEVEMYVQDNAPGFTATMTTFSGELETDFPLKVEENTQRGGNNQRIIGRYGDGQVKVTLDSFSGAARIKKGGAGKSCK